MCRRCSYTDHESVKSASRRCEVGTDSQWEECSRGSSCLEGRMWQLCRSMCTACWTLTICVYSNKCILYMLPLAMPCVPRGLRLKSASKDVQDIFRNASLPSDFQTPAPSLHLPKLHVLYRSLAYWWLPCLLPTCRIVCELAVGRSWMDTFRSASTSLAFDTKQNKHAISVRRLTNCAHRHFPRTFNL